MTRPERRRASSPQTERPKIAAAKQADPVVRIDDAAARRLTTKIQLRLDVIADNVEQVIPLITEAKAGNIHEVLGYRSWTAYVAEEFGGRLQRLARADRRSLVQLLAGEGMSSRAIAPILGVGKSTVARELTAGVPDGTPELKPVVGIDGKTYARPNAVQRADGNEDGSHDGGSEPSCAFDPIAMSLAHFKDDTKALLSSRRIKENVEDYRKVAKAVDRFIRALHKIGREYHPADHITPEWKTATAEAPDPLRKWARQIESISGCIPYAQLPADDLADAQGAAEFLHYLLRGESRTRSTAQPPNIGSLSKEVGSR